MHTLAYCYCYCPMFCNFIDNANEFENLQPAKLLHSVLGFIIKTRCEAKHGCSPPTVPLTTCYLLLICFVTGSPASIECNDVICLPSPCIAMALLVVYWRRHPSECHLNCCKAWNKGRFCPQNWLPRQRPLMGRKKLTSRHLSAAKVLPILQISWRSVQ